MCSDLLKKNKTVQFLTLSLIIEGVTETVLAFIKLQWSIYKENVGFMIKNILFDAAESLKR